MRYIRFFDAIGIDDVALVGGKNASLGEMYRHLADAEVRVPFGFATTAEAYALYLEHNDLGPLIVSQLADLDIQDVPGLQRRGKTLREALTHAQMPDVLAKEIDEAYARLCTFYGREAVDVAVRSSATAEDLPDASFAGQQESFLNVRGASALKRYVKRCFASLFTDRAISYRHSRGFEHLAVSLCVGVQKMVRSDGGSSGVMFTIDTQSGNPNFIMINSIWGLGENIVGGRVNPDEFYLFKPTLEQGFKPIVKRHLGSKEMKMVYDEKAKTLNVVTSQLERERFSLSDEEALELGRYALAIEAHYTQRAGRYTPMDIEWGKDAEDGLLYILQARPETVQSKKRRGPAAQTLERYRLDAAGAKVLACGHAIGEKIGSGKVKVIRSLQEASRFAEGDVLVADLTDPDWEPLMKRASAVVTNRGGRTCHAAIVAREIGVTTIVGTADATETLAEGAEVTVDCSQGEEGNVYEGVLPFEVETIDLSTLEAPKTKLYMNVGNPDRALAFAAIPNQGVGLARMEFIINNYINAHPMALYEMHRGERYVEGEAQIRETMAGFEDPKTYFLKRLSAGVGMIAAAFYPNPVIVRTSDFKSNEYKHMPGGMAFEQDEENPMIGFRGASRYYSEAYIEAFRWECEALKRVRDEMGLTNVRLMIPFVRTPEEGRRVIAIMNEMGLVQGENGLEIYAMCEIPSNVIFAEEFLKVFDGFSIGSNDLTQLTLGVDRDSTLVAHIFDERNEAVKRMLKMAIDACKRADKYIGICGQAPSDYPEITEFLVENGIDSISLNPDSVMKMRQVVVELERRLHR